MAKAAEPGAEDLRRKYVDLSRKYVALVDRTRHRAEGQTGLLRLGAFGLRATEAAMALFRAGKLQVANTRFAELDRGGPWKLAGGRSFATLLLALTWIAEHPGEQPPLLLASEDGRQLQLKLEHAPGRTTLALLSDVTDELRGERDLQGAREALLQFERLRMLGEVAAAVVHDLGSTLRSMSMRLSALDATQKPGQRESLQALAEALRAAENTVRRLHDYARLGSLEAEPVDLRTIITRACALLEMELETRQSGVHLRFRSPELPLLRASAAELSHLFLNLLRNAADAMPDGGAIEIAARRQPGALIVVVSDEGKGFPEGARIFEPFFTTKGARGTGLGLWLAAGTMSRLGGTIIASARRKGTAFTLTFPLPATISRRPRGGARRG